MALHRDTWTFLAVAVAGACLFGIGVLVNEPRALACAAGSGDCTTLAPFRQLGILLVLAALGGWVMSRVRPAARS